MARPLLSAKTQAGISRMTRQFFPHTCTLTPPDVYPDTSTDASRTVPCSALEIFRQDGSGMTDYATVSAKRIDFPAHVFANASECRGFVISNICLDGQVIEAAPFVVQIASALRADGQIHIWSLNIQGFG